MKNTNWLITASILAAIAVAAGAFGAHGLKKLVEPQYVDTFKTGAQYQFYHALAIGFASIISQFVDNVWIKRANQAFLFGIILFSGSLYVLVASKVVSTEGVNWFGAITPLGGVFFLLGWLSLIKGLKEK
jgi:uncharacterized membrane protein YgdD (TMEM256/DUF423 family)